MYVPQQIRRISHARGYSLTIKLSKMQLLGQLSTLRWTLVLQDYRQWTSEPYLTTISSTLLSKLHHRLLVSLNITSVSPLESVQLLGQTLQHSQARSVSHHSSNLTWGLYLASPICGYSSHESTGHSSNS